MRVPGITQEAEQPTGGLPRNLQYYVIAGIAVLVVVATLWTGGKPRKPDDHVPPTGPTPGQLQTFQQMLERQRGTVDQEAARRLAQLQQEQTRQTAAVVTPAMPPAVAEDPFEEQRRKRAASAPFASNYVVRSESTEKKEEEGEAAAEKAKGQGERGDVDRASQVVFTGAAKSADAKQTSAKSTSPPPKESGRSLPTREGDLFRLFEGTLVRATLVNRLDGSFTGPVNCVVSAAILSQDETALLIPKASRFIGKADRVEAGNQTRLAVTFKRLILPNGYSINLEAAPGLDSAGETGLRGKVDNHNMSKFGIAGAVGLLGGLALYAGQANPYAAGVANSTGSSATTILNHYLNQVPTITVPEGHPVNIYLPADLLLPAYRP
jgi:type IV secretory pathway VirB10-like protein